MADEIPEQNRPAEESKKDTVRINLPPGITGRGTPGTGAPPPSPMAKPKAPGAPASPEDEAKRETSVMARPTEAPKPKKDTSRVQVVAAKPITAGGPRPAIKLQHEDETPAAPEAAAAMPGAGPSGKGAKPAGRPAPVGAGAPSGAEAGLSLVAIVLSLAVAGYLAYIAFG
jgi:translation initiation factor IF-2